WRRSHDHLSFTNTKLAEDGIENLLHIYDANNFTNRSQRLIEINGDVFRRQSIAQDSLRAIARFQSATKAIAMTRIDCDRVFRPQVLLPNAHQNFPLQVEHSVSGHAGNA